MTQQDLINEGYADGKKSFEYLWNKIEKSFDFNKVYTAMKALDWHWCFHEENYGIPRVDYLKEKARELLHDAYENGKGSIRSGGFIVGCEGGELWINFSIEDCHTSDL